MVYHGWLFLLKMAFLSKKLFFIIFALNDCFHYLERECETKFGLEAQK